MHYFPNQEEHISHLSSIPTRAVLPRHIHRIHLITQQPLAPREKRGCWVFVPTTIQDGYLRNHFEFHLWVRKKGCKSLHTSQDLNQTFSIEFLWSEEGQKRQAETAAQVGSRHWPADTTSETLSDFEHELWELRGMSIHMDSIHFPSAVMNTKLWLLGQWFCFYSNINKIAQCQKLFRKARVRKLL